ncbi:unnamed protein product, partial [Musa hybrid cultivar]
ASRYNAVFLSQDIYTSNASITATSTGKTYITTTLLCLSQMANPFFGFMQSQMRFISSPFPNTMCRHQIVDMVVVFFNPTCK